MKHVSLLLAIVMMTSMSTTAFAEDPSSSPTSITIEQEQPTDPNAPTLDADEEWEFWFAEQFNAYRGLSGNAPVETSPQNSSAGSSSNKIVDTEAFASEVIALIKRNGMQVSSGTKRGAVPQQVGRFGLLDYLNFQIIQ